MNPRARANCQQCNAQYDYNRESKSETCWHDRWYLTDDRGVLCPREAVDAQTGCCTRGQKHACDMCESSDRTFQLQ